MDLHQKLSFLINVLSQLEKPDDKEHSMVSVTTGNEKSFTPDLFQVIDMYDGTFCVQQLESTCDSKGYKNRTHQVTMTKIVGKQDMGKIPTMCKSYVSMELWWGPDLLIEYK